MRRKPCKTEGTMLSVIALGRSKWQQSVTRLAKHKNIVTIVSAFIVFASFMIKDDHLRESDGISSQPKIILSLGSFRDLTRVL